MADIRDEMTARLLSDSGIGPSMRVLDVGCGRGDVSMMIARLVGNEGYVLGIDKDVRPLVTARERVRELGVSNIEFAEGDLCGLSSELGSFDAIVGRRVLMYQPNAVLAVRELVRSLRPGGLVVFQEHDSTTVGAPTALPLHERVQDLIWRTVELEGADVHMGFHLANVLAQADLIVDHVRAEAVVQAPGVHYPYASVVRAMLPRIVQHGVATVEEIDVDTLDQRLIDELDQAKSVFIGDMVFGIWARKPS